MWVQARLQTIGPRARVMALVLLCVIPALCLVLVTAWEQRNQEIDSVARDARRLATIAAGDAVLIEVAHRLRRCARPADIVARLGGDEFTVLLEDVPGATTGRAVAGRILAALSTPFVMDDQEIYLTVSIGIAIGPATQQDPDVLLARADQALHQAKMAGKAQTVLFDAEDESVAAYRAQAS